LARQPHLAGLTPEERRLVMTHPNQVVAKNFIGAMIDQLRVATTPADYFEFQRVLVGNLLEVEKQFSIASRMWKRESKGRREGTPLTGNWLLERFVHRRIADQLRSLRSLGDAPGLDRDGSRPTHYRGALHQRPSLPQRIVAGQTVGAEGLEPPTFAL
jgi:hypothetical protein